MDEVIWNLLRFNKWQDLSVSSAAQQSVHTFATLRQVGFAATYGEYFSLDSPPGQAGFEFILLSNRVHARPSASNANRSAASIPKSK
jgi:hypothetical protein